MSRLQQQWLAVIYLHYLVNRLNAFIPLMMSGNNVRQKTFGVELLICQEVYEYRFHCQGIFLCQFVTEDIVLHFVARLNDLPYLLKFLGADILILQCITSVCKYTIANALTDIENLLVSRINKAIHIVS